MFLFVQCSFKIVCKEHEGVEGGKTLSEPKLLGSQQLVLIKEGCQFIADNLLQNFSEVWQQRNRPIIV